MKSLSARLAGAGLLAACLSAPLSADGFKPGVRVGTYTQVGEPFVGGELLIRVAHRVYFNPNVEFVFVNRGSYFTVNGDFHYDFPTRHPTYVWLGGGLGLVAIDPPGSNNSDTSLAANFLGGVGFRTGSLIPYFQAKVIAKHDTEFSLAFGLRF